MRNEQNQKKKWYRRSVLFTNSVWLLCYLQFILSCTKVYLSLILFFIGFGWFQLFCFSMNFQAYKCSPHNRKSNLKKMEKKIFLLLDIIYVRRFFSIWTQFFSRFNWNIFYWNRFYSPNIGLWWIIFYIKM